MEERIIGNQSDLLQTPAVVEEKKANIGLLIAISLIVILLIGVGGVYAGMQIGKKQVAGGLLTKVTPTLVLQPTIIPTSEEITNWKTYSNQELGFSIKYPSALYVYEEGWREGKPIGRRFWNIQFASLDKEKTKEVYNDNTGKLERPDLYPFGYYKIAISIEYNPIVNFSSTRSEPLSEKNLEEWVRISSHIDSSKNIKHFDFQGRYSIEHRDSFVSGSRMNELGESHTYKMLDGKRYLRVQGTTYNTKKVPVLYVDQILSTFKFTDQISQNISSSEESQIKNLVTQFEKYIQERNVNLLMPLFTPAKTKEEIESYQSLMGLSPDVGAPRLFNNVSSNFIILDWKISRRESPDNKELITKENERYLVTVEETRKSWCNADPCAGTYSFENTRFYIFEIVNLSSQWKVDKYYLMNQRNVNGGLKYEALGF